MQATDVDTRLEIDDKNKEAIKLAGVSIIPSETTTISRNSYNKIIFFSTTNILHYRRSEIKIGNDYLQGLIHRRKTHKLFIIIGPTWNIHLLDNSPSLIA